MNLSSYIRSVPAIANPELPTILPAAGRVGPSQAKYASQEAEHSHRNRGGPQRQPSDVDAEQPDEAKKPEAGAPDNPAD